MSELKAALENTTVEVRYPFVPDWARCEIAVRPNPFPKIGEATLSTLIVHGTVNGAPATFECAGRALPG